jgi:hypothetical protein
MVIEDFEGADIILDGLEKTSPNPFERIIVMRGNSTIKGRFNGYANQASNSRKIKKLMDETGPSGAFIFNDSRAEGQALIRTNKKNGGTNHYVEDGLAAYSDHLMAGTTGIGLYVAKLLFGPSYELVRVLGTSSNIDILLLIQPEHARKELSMERLFRIPRGTIDGAVPYCNVLVGESNESRGCLLLMPLSSRFDDEHKRRMIDFYDGLVERLREKDVPVSIKFHPREEEPGRFSFSSKGDILDKYLPMESIIINDPHRFQIVIGDYSTSILMARYLIEKEANVYSIVSCSGLFDYPEEDIDLLKNMGVEVPKGPDELFHGIDTSASKM